MLKHLKPGDVSEICDIAGRRHGLESLERIYLIDPDDPDEVLAIDLSTQLTDQLETRIDSLSPDAKAELIALTWLGRGDEVGADFSTLLAYAKRTNDEGTSRYLASKWPLAVYLERGLRQLQP